MSSSSTSWPKSQQTSHSADKGSRGRGYLFLHNVSHPVCLNSALGGKGGLPVQARSGAQIQVTRKNRPLIWVAPVKHQHQTCSCSYPLGTAGPSLPLKVSQYAWGYSWTIEGIVGLSSRESKNLDGMAGTKNTCMLSINQLGWRTRV